MNKSKLEDQGLVTIHDPTIDIEDLMFRAQSQAAMRRALADPFHNNEVATLQFQIKSHLTSIRQLLSDFGDVGPKVKTVKGIVFYFTKRLVRKLIGVHLYRQQQINERIASNLDLLSRLSHELNNSMINSQHLKSSAETELLSSNNKNGSEQALFYTQHFSKERGPIAQLDCTNTAYLESFLKTGFVIFGCQLQTNQNSADPNYLALFQGNLFSFLNQLKPESLGGIILSSCIDSLPETSAIELLNICASKLKTHALLIIESKNLNACQSFAESLNFSEIRVISGPQQSVLLVRK